MYFVYLNSDLHSAYFTGQIHATTCYVWPHLTVLDRIMSWGSYSHVGPLYYLVTIVMKSCLKASSIKRSCQIYSVQWYISSWNKRILIPYIVHIKDNEFATPLNSWFSWGRIWSNCWANPIILAGREWSLRRKLKEAACWPHGATCLVVLGMPDWLNLHFRSRTSSGMRRSP